MESSMSQENSNYNSCVKMTSGKKRPRATKNDESPVPKLKTQLAILLTNGNAVRARGLVFIRGVYTVLMSLL